MKHIPDRNLQKLIETCEKCISFGHFKSNSCCRNIVAIQNFDQVNISPWFPGYTSGRSLNRQWVSSSNNFVRIVRKVLPETHSFSTKNITLAQKFSASRPLLLLFMQVLIRGNYWCSHTVFLAIDRVFQWLKVLEKLAKVLGKSRKLAKCLFSAKTCFLKAGRKKRYSQMTYKLTRRNFLLDIGPQSLGCTPLMYPLPKLMEITFENKLVGENFSEKNFDKNVPP